MDALIALMAHLSVSWAAASLCIRYAERAPIGYEDEEGFHYGTRVRE